MGRRSFIPVLLIAVAAALGLAWWLLQAGPSRTVASNEIALEESVADDAAPLELREERPETDVKPVFQSGPDSATEDASATTAETDEVEPSLHVPDYGPALKRGGGVVTFELYDAAGWRVPTELYVGELWRRVGEYWLREELSIDRNANVVRCDGLGGSGAKPAGLEPGEYELELESSTMGNFRHTFMVNKGEARTDKLTTPLYRRTVAIWFLDQNDEPVPYIPSGPQVTVSPQPLDVKTRAKRYHLELRASPLDPLGMGGGGGWASSGRPFHRVSRNQLLRTDDGRWWVHVYAGAENSVRFKLDSGLWGQDVAEVVGDFTTGEEFVVRLNLPSDFATAAEQWGRVSTRSPGNRTIIEKHEPELEAEFDPYTAPVADGATRVIVEVESPVMLKLEISMVKADKPNRPWRVFKGSGSLFWYDLGDFSDFAWRATDGDLYTTAWKPIPIGASRVVTLKHVMDAPLTRMDMNALSPTVGAFAHVLELGIATRKIAGTEGEEGVASESLKSKRGDAPEGYALFDTLVAIAGKYRGSLLGGHRLEAADVSEGLICRTELRGAARYRRPRSGGVMYGPDGRTIFDPVVLRGDWEAVDTLEQGLASSFRDGLLRPHMSDVFAARAVGPSLEGLPWVVGVVVDHEEDAVAQEVRVLSRSLSKNGKRPYIARAGSSDYAGDYAAASAEPTEASLRGILGDDVYAAFDTDEQRLWYARNNSWYDTSRKFYSDEHGYIMKQNPGLEPGRVYVLYLWSNSKDDLYPDARIVFKADENGVADIGAIHLPTFTD